MDEGVLAPGPGGGTGTRTVRAVAQRWPRVGAVEWACLLALAVLPAGIMVWFALVARRHGLVWTGVDNGVVADFMQYLNWTRQAAEHGLVANLYDLGPQRHTFLHPGVLLSGLLSRAGLSTLLSYQLWTPAAVGVVWAAALALASRHLSRPGDRGLALVLALFAVSPLAAVFDWSHALGGPLDRLAVLSLAGEMWTVTQLCGYMLAAVAVGLVAIAVLAYERGREGNRRALVLAAAAGGLAAWLQPWQGTTVALVLLAGESVLLVRARPGRAAVLGRLRVLALPLAGTVAPLAYYFILSKVDPAWELAGEINAAFPPRWPAWTIALTLAPFAPALLAYRLPAPRFGDVALRAWPVAALAVYLLPGVTFPFHAWQGVQLPLGVLLVLALRARLGSRPLSVPVIVGVVGVLVVPGTLERLWALRATVQEGGQAWFLRPGEANALDFLERDPRSGGVLADEHLGALAPARTGRPTWVGTVSWTPDYFSRAFAVRRLVSGAMTRPAAARYVKATGARWLLASCRDADLRGELASVTVAVRRFGCASVYRLRRG